MKVRILASCAAIVWVLVGAPGAFAHRITIFAYMEGDRVHTESYFPDGTKCKGASVSVYDPQGTLLLQGKTDEAGVFEFPNPASGDLRIVVEASMGHRAETVLRQETSSTQPTQVAASEAPPSPTANRVGNPPSAELDALLARRLAPLIASVDALRKAQEQAQFRDVLGGIGYIFGLMGLAMMLTRRREKR